MCGSAPADFELSYFCLFLLQFQLDQKKTSTNRKTNPSTTVRMICGNNDLLRQEISLRMKLVKTILNAYVVIFGLEQTDKDGIIRCAIIISNFSMWDKLLHYSVGKLQENYNSF